MIKATGTSFVTGKIALSFTKCRVKEMTFACPTHNIMMAGNILHADSVLVIGQGVEGPEERYCDPMVNQLKIYLQEDSTFDT